MRKSSRVTIRDVARVCGVSPMTVSYVLNGKREKVGTDTCDRVLQAVRDLNYVPTSVSTAGHAAGTITLGLITDMPYVELTRPEGGYVNAILIGILERADELEHNVTLFTSRLLRADIHRSIRIFCDGKCDGLVVFSPFRDSPLVMALQERGKPFITIGNLPHDPSISGVDVDDVEIGEKVVHYLVEQGHERIVYVNILNLVESSNRRAEGYRKAMAAHHLRTPSEDFIVWHPSKNDIEKSYLDAMHTLSQMPPDQRPTALFCFNDLAALICIRGLRAEGLRVPEDVSVVGVDDSTQAVTMGVQLTTVRQPYKQIGFSAVDCLTSIITGEAQTPVRVLLGSSMVLRETVARLGKEPEETDASRS